MMMRLSRILRLSSHSHCAAMAFLKKFMDQAGSLERRMISGLEQSQPGHLA